MGQTKHAYRILATWKSEKRKLKCGVLGKQVVDGDVEVVPHGTSGMEPPGYAETVETSLFCTFCHDPSVTRL